MLVSKLGHGPADCGLAEGRSHGSGNVELERIVYEHARLVLKQRLSGGMHPSRSDADGPRRLSPYIVAERQTIGLLTRFSWFAEASRAR